MNNKAGWILLFFVVLQLIDPSTAGVFDFLKSKFQKDKPQKSDLADGGMVVSQGSLSPVIILPGDGGSQIQAWLDRPSVLHKVCQSKTNGWTNVWADFDMLIPNLVDCWVDNLKLFYNNLTRKTENAKGVRTFIPGFGDTNTIEYLTKTKLPTSKYLATLVDMLVKNGYQRGISVRGAPYDFRKAQNEQQEYFVALKKLVEDTYELNKQSKITFIGHSLGCLYTLYFLNTQSDTWKDKYVLNFIAMGGPWGGAVKPMKVIATGDDLDIAIVSRSRIRDVLRTNPSVVALLPTDKFWKLNESLIVTPQKSYSLGNLKEFFHDINFPEGWDFYMDTKSLVYDLIPPKVNVYCLSGTGTATPLVYVYKDGGFPHSKPMVATDDGDGTVNRRSLDGCSLWEGKQKQLVVSKKFAGAGHRQMTRDDQVLNYIQSILFP